MSVIGVNGNLTPTKFADSKLNIGLAGYSFGIKQLPVGSAATTNGVGIEIDVKLAYEFNEYSNLAVSYGILLPPGNVNTVVYNTITAADITGPDAIAQILATLNLKF